MATRTPPHGYGLALVRITLGALATLRGWTWTRSDLPFEGLLRATKATAKSDLPGPLAWWWEHIVLYNPDATVFLVSWLTLAAGIACTLGLFTRPAASALAFFALHVAIFDEPTARPVAVLVFVCAAACALARAGWSLGLDRALDGSLPTWMTWVGRTDKSSPF